MPRRWLGGLVCGAITSATCAVGAAPRVHVDWSGTASCAEHARIEAEVERLLARAPASSDELRVAARVEQVGPARYRLVLETSDAGNRFRRELDAASCEELTKPAALIIALSIDPEATARAPAEQTGAASGGSGEETPAEAGTEAPLAASPPVRDRAGAAPQPAPEGVQRDLVKVEAHLDLRNPSQSWAGTSRCPPPGQTMLSGSACSARYTTRLAGPGDCENVIGNTPCATSAVCDSGCGTPCRCEGGRWQCELPKVGQACWGEESCSYRIDDAGSQEGIACRTVAGGQPMMTAFERASVPEVCPVEQPAPDSPCNLYPRSIRCAYPGNPPTQCTCEAGSSASIDEWHCQQILTSAAR